jgi:hypothetical protein
MLQQANEVQRHHQQRQVHPIEQLDSSSWETSDEFRM